MERRIVVISGPSGVGKTTLVKALTRSLPNVTVCKSITTRKPRSGEARKGDELEYIHVSDQEFDQYIQEERLLEYKSHPYNHCRYGTLDSGVTPAELEINRGFLIFNVDSKGQEALRRKYEKSGLYVSIYMLASYQTIEERLLARKEAKEQIEARLNHAAENIGECFGGYDYILIADRPIDEIVKDVQHIVFDPNNFPPLPPRGDFERALDSFKR